MCQRSEWSRNVLLYDTAFQLIGYSWRSPVPTDTFRTNIKAMRSGRNSIAGRRPVSHSPFLLHRLTGVDALVLPRTYIIVLPIHSYTRPWSYRSGEYVTFNGNLLVFMSSFYWHLQCLSFQCYSFLSCHTMLCHCFLQLAYCKLNLHIVT